MLSHLLTKNVAKKCHFHYFGHITVPKHRFLQKLYENLKSARCKIDKILRVDKSIPLIERLAAHFSSSEYANPARMFGWCFITFDNTQADGESGCHSTANLLTHAYRTCWETVSVKKVSLPMTVSTESEISGSSSTTGS